MTLNGKLPKIAKCKYLSNHWSVLLHTLNESWPFLAPYVINTINNKITNIFPIIHTYILLLKLNFLYGVLPTSEDQADQRQTALTQTGS